MDGMRRSSINSSWNRSWLSSRYFNADDRDMASSSEIFTTSILPRITIPFPAYGKGIVLIDVSVGCQRRFDLFLLFELAHVQVVIKALFRQQLIMFATFDDLAIFQNQDHICITDGRQAMRDDKSGATLEQFIKRFLDETLGARVHAGGGVVQD